MQYPPAVLAAAVLTVEHVSCLLVGSAALWLRGERIPVRDADVVIEPGEQNLCQLAAGLARMALLPAAVPPVHRLSSLPLATVATSYGNVDCLLERGRLDWARLRHRAEVLPVADTGVLTADAADAWWLRRRFKQ